MFDVTPSQIQSLTSLQLVELLRRLLHAEALVSELELGNISVPLQITIADGGEDGRISWEGGKESTDYFPGRINVFQSKATSMGPAAWKKECWVKSTQRKGATRKLTPALTSLIAEGGSYLGFTTEAMTSAKQRDCVKAIREGIREAKGDDAELKAVKIYGANEIASWSERHSAVAIWLAEQVRLQTLAGYRTIDSWGTLDDFVKNAYAQDPDERYAIGAHVARDDTASENRTTAEIAWRRILEHVAVPRTVVRVVGASGLGKSRFVFQSLRATSSQIAGIFNVSAIFADYRVVASSILPRATWLAERGLPTLLIVDECPRDVAITLAQTAASSSSQLRVITLDTNDRPLEGTSVLHIKVFPSTGDLVSAIIRTQNSEIDDVALDRLRDLCGGFPKFAVLAAGNPSLKTSDFESADDVVDRILEGTSIISENEVRALQTLSLCESVPIESTSGNPSPLDQLATNLGRMSGDEMYEHLAKARQHDLVGHYGGAFIAQPVPIAVNLASRRLKVIRPSLLQSFLSGPSGDLSLSLLRRWRHLDNSPTVIEAASQFLRNDASFSTAEKLLTPHTTALVDGLVHIVPDLVSDLLQYTLLKSPERLPDMELDARRHFVEALSKLVFRSRSFGTASRLLMRLAANETEEWENNASALFKQLYKLHLSGTEVSPAQRFAILDEGLASDDSAVVSLCVDALENVFTRDFIRFGDAGQIGSGPRLIDWSPKTREDVDAFYLDAIRRLVAIRVAKPEFAQRSENTLARAARLLLGTDVHKEYARHLREIAREKAVWLEAIESVGDWLYFERPETSSAHSKSVRQLYADLFPADPVDRAILFTKFWRTDIRDPDARYSMQHRDFDYSERQARAVAKEIAASPSLTSAAVARMTPLDLKTIHPFAEELARNVDDSKSLFDTVLNIAEESGTGLTMLRGVLRGIDLDNRDLANKCLEAAKLRLSGQFRIELYAALSMDKGRLQALLVDIRAGSIDPARCAFLSYGRGFDELDISDLAELLVELASHGGDGLWAALEISMMYRYGAKPSEEHARLIGELITNPNIVAAATQHRQDAHIVDDLVQKIQHLIGEDPALAEGLAGIVGRLVETEDYKIFSVLDDAVRNIVAMLRESAPLVIWSHVTQLYGSATPIERNRLKRLIGPSPGHFERSRDSAAGPLFGIPEDAVLKWVDGHPESAPLLIDFYPILQESDSSQWHPELEKIALRYGESGAFTHALARRMQPSSWSGSIVPLLKIYLKPLQSWFAHPIPSLAAWASEQYHLMERRIEIERGYEKAAS